MNYKRKYTHCEEIIFPLVNASNYVNSATSTLDNADGVTLPPIHTLLDYSPIPPPLHYYGFCPNFTMFSPYGSVQNTNFQRQAAKSKLITQPNEIQIANYNVHPMIAVVLEQAIPEIIRVHVCLIDYETGIRIPNGPKHSGEFIYILGLQGKTSFTIPANKTALQLQNLKFNKIAPIKEDLANSKITAKKGRKYCVQITFEHSSHYLQTTPFLIKSSTNQLTEDVKLANRPKKQTKRARNSNDEVL